MVSKACEQALSSVAKLNKSFKKFIIETMICYLSITGRVNFSQMARFSTSCESRFRQNFKKRFDWVKFNTVFASPSDGHLRAIDPCFIPKSGKKTPGLGYFWSGTANAAKMGLEIHGMALVDAVMIQRIISTFGKSPNLNLNQSKLKELLFLGVKNAA